MNVEIFSATDFESAWTQPSDVWVLLDPETNHWTEKIDWSLGMLLRRALLRIEAKPSASDDVLLIAAPEGMPTAKILVLREAHAREDNWLKELSPILTKMKAGSATIFAPREWRPPTAKQIAHQSQGEWGLRWVESAH